MAKRFLNASTAIIHLIRYRFLLFAGLLPYCLGAVVAYREAFAFDLRLFLTGLAGIFFTLVGVEAFNEYFDWILGTDRVFQLNPKPVTKKKFYIGVSAFAVALVFAIYLTLQVGIGIVIFAVLGFVAAAGYLGPPVKFTYRGLGEIVIALAYGPAMVLGSYYLQTATIDFLPLVISVIPALFLFLIAVTNEVPDFIQDGLVGKRNLCVRFGRKGVVAVYPWLVGLIFFILVVMPVLHLLPYLVWLALLFIPIVCRNYNIARSKFEDPVEFLPVIKWTIILYASVMSLIIISYIVIQ